MNKKQINIRSMLPPLLRPLSAAILGMLAWQAQAAAPPPPQSQNGNAFTGLGFLGTGNYSTANAISADGSAVVGVGVIGDFIQAFRWSNGAVTGLGFLGTGNYSIAHAVSADGSVVAGVSSYDNFTGNSEAFRWEGGTMTGLGFLGTGINSYATAVSSDGSAVVGTSDYNVYGYQEAFRWTDGIMTGLGFLGTGTNSYANAVSADGSVVVGASSYDNSGNPEAFRWADGVMTGLGFLGTGTTSGAIAVSADGNVVVGNSTYCCGVGSFGFFSPEAFRWSGGVMTGLGFLGTGTASVATAVSADGSAVVGYSGYDSSFNGVSFGGNTEAFRWKDGVMTGLGFLGTSGMGNNNSYANAMSADGSVVVGQSTYNGSSGQEAFRWTQATQMQSINQWLAGAGVTIPTGWSFQSATGVSANGTVVTGNGIDANVHPEAWLARVSSQGSGLLTNITAFNNSLLETGSRGIQAGAVLPGLTLFGAHHRSILDSGLIRTGRNGGCGWATGDVASYNQSGARSQLAEAGICKDISTARIGFGVGQAWSQQSLSLNGNANYNGQYFLVEAANAFANGLQPSVTGYYGIFDSKMRRSYMNGANTDSSNANPNAYSYAVRARLDWKNAAELFDFGLSPYTAYTWSKTNLDAYTETGGGFPAQFAASSYSTHDFRIGAAAKTTFFNSTDLRLALEGIHRFNDNTSGTTGQVIGLWNFSQSGQQLTQTWARALVDVDHRITDAIAVTVGANAAPSGAGPTWGVTAGLRANF